MVNRIRKCPHCGAEIEVYKNPVPTVDIIIAIDRGIVLIKRKNPPFGWAIPGGFVDYGESIEDAAVREAKEETNLDVELIGQFHTYSEPSRDPRHHTITTLFIAKPTGGCLTALDDAEEAGVFERNCLPRPLAFDHECILEDYFSSSFYKGS